MKSHSSRSVLLLSLLLGLAGCATPARKLPPVQDTEPNFAREIKRPALPSQEMSKQVLYETLLAEIALQRGENALAARAYLDLLERTRDYRIAERAAQVALHARLPDEALLAAGKWLELEPASVAARQTVAGILVSKGRLEEARPHLEQLLAAEGANLGHGFMHLNNLLARHPDKQASLALVRHLSQAYPKLPEARFSVARAAWSAGQGELALQEIRAALQLRPEWEGAALFQAQILQSSAPSEATDYYLSYLKQNPKAREMRLAYARFLVQQKQFPQARAEFQSLVQDFPDNPDVPLAVGLISMQIGEHEVAEQYLKQALESGAKNDDAVRLYLGQVNEELKRYEEARKWYDSVDGEQAFAAKLRYAAVLAKEGKPAEARQYLQQIAPASNQQRVQLAQTEAQLLRDGQQYEESYNVLSRALEKLPNHPDLLYDRAMAAEKVGRLDVLESSLRKLIEIKPDHAHAYNALGYTLADRTNRFAEARTLLEQALKLAPEDPFILDSMGWLYFRMKEYDQATAYLRRALGIRADPEIAAHLGEVLWVKGERSEAEQVWAGALKNHPAHEALMGVINKFKSTKP